jgi:hypothetical protein
MRPASLILSSALLVGSLATDASAESAIHGENRPTPVEGQTNGEMTADALIFIEGDCRVARAAGPSLALMLEAARHDGVRLLADDCYRPRRRQAAAHTRNCNAGNCACAAPAGNSMHGWGKAVDFDDQRGTLRFTSDGYRWMKGNAARYGWNHPRWAEPGGSECPEAWHWEWVGDGGKMNLDPVRADVVGLMPHTSGRGYWVATGLGAVAARGEAVHAGGAEGMPLQNLLVDAAAHPKANGYWLVGTDGAIFGFGDAGYHGGANNRRLARPIVGMAPTPSGNGYWLVASDGGVFGFGDAGFHGSLGGQRLNRPIVGMAATPSGNGYWLVASDGGVFSFGDAGFHGSLAGRAPARPVVGIAPTPGAGYWLASADGAVSAFGDAVDAGGLTSPPTAPVASVKATPTGAGYWLVGADGGVFTFGDAPFLGTG